MMCEELIKQLKHAAQWADFGLLIPPSLCLKAADAIEELCRLHEAQRQNLIALMNEEPDMEWIPVTERLPKDGEFVLVCNDDGHMMIAKHETETYEWYYKYTNYDFDIWDNEEQGPVCYWMPLPEPPKEEHDGV